ncbi:MAG: hypothetical protein J0H17_11835 [Rhizobiales bacterium]|jgi:hypothetical protein|nr:hypothetical protein [Hyphomicrobiales bacterium]
MRVEEARIQLPTERARSLRAILILAAFVPLFPFILLVGILVHVAYVPAASASANVAEIGAMVTLRFYPSSDDARYFTVATAQGTITRNICGFDWAHHARTSLYLTEQRQLVVLGAEGGCHLIFTLSPLRFEMRIDATNSNRWEYLGAFDYAPGLRFILPSEQSECLTQSDNRAGNLNARRWAWRDRCPPPDVSAPRQQP